jgi:chromosome segregation ATPase
LLALSPSLIPFSATAESLDIAIISEAISSKKAEIQSTVSQQTDIQATIRRLNAELDQAEKEASTLENTRVKAKQALERQYAQMLEDPDLDLSSSQKAYQDAWARLKQNQQNQLDIQHDIQEQRIKLSSTKAEGVKLDAELLGLEDSHYRLRAQRLRGELTLQTSQTVSYTQVTSRCRLVQTPSA